MADKLLMSPITSTCSATGDPGHLPALERALTFISAATLILLAQFQTPEQLGTAA
jgi:hypothetical protein